MSNVLVQGRVERKDITDPKELEEYDAIEDYYREGSWSLGLEDLQKAPKTMKELKDARQTMRDMLQDMSLWDYIMQREDFSWRDMQIAMKPQFSSITWYPGAELTI